MTEGPAAAPAVLAAHALEKRYPGVHALRGVDLALSAGRVHAICGENGAGKSTLMKLLSGAEQPDGGTLLLDGAPVRFATPREAQHAGIRMIHQELSLVPALSVAENIFLGEEPVRGGRIDRRALHRGAEAVLARLGQHIAPRAMVGRLPLAARQMTEIAKSLVRRARVLIMDEPTAILARADQEVLFRLIAQLREEGIAIAYISHRLDEIARVADEVTVLRDGARVTTRPASAVSERDLVQLMVGRELGSGYPPPRTAPGDVVLDVSRLSAGIVRDVSFTVRRGEIVGLAGLVGSGRTELARALFGADPIERGTVRLDGRPYSPRSPREAIAAGVGLLPEDRKAQGLIVSELVRRNITLPTLRRFAPGGVLRQRLERAAAATSVSGLAVRENAVDAPARTLSGGTQQKIVLAKWLLASSRLLIFDEPTRGIDVGAKAEIYALMRELGAGGAAILMISSDLPEAVGMSDRLLIMRDGRIRGELTDTARTADAAAQLMLGAEPDARGAA